MTTYTIVINEHQRAWMQKAMERLAADVDEGKVATLHASDPLPDDFCWAGDCVADELEALRDMLRIEGTTSPLMPGDCINGLCT